MTAPVQPRGDMLSTLWRRGALPTDLSLADWADLLGQARASLLGARLALWLQAHGGLDAVPERPRQYLRNAVEVAQRQQTEVGWELAQIQRALRPLDAPVLLLKGAAYIAAGLPAAQGRTLSDIDILVPRSRLADAEAALLRAGWISQERDAYNQRYYRQWMHEIPPLSHIRRGTVVDLHHTVTAPTSSFAVDGAALIAQARPLDASDAQWCVLQPVDMVLHSAVHLFQEGEFGHGLRDLLDMDLLLHHFQAADPGFWPQLVARAADLRLTVPLHHALHHIERLFGPRVPAGQRAAVDAMAPPWPQRALMAGLLARALRPEHPSAAAGGEALARTLLYLRSHWLRMPLHLLVPHLVRKAWMRQFPEPNDEPVVRG